jgi:hypothetical protein
MGPAILLLNPKTSKDENISARIIEISKAIRFIILHFTSESIVICLSMTAGRKALHCGCGERFT